MSWYRSCRVSFVHRRIWWPSVDVGLWGKSNDNIERTGGAVQASLKARVSGTALLDNASRGCSTNWTSFQIRRSPLWLVAFVKYVNIPLSACKCVCSLVYKKRKSWVCCLKLCMLCTYFCTATIGSCKLRHFVKLTKAISQSMHLNKFAENFCNTNCHSL